MLSTVVCQLLKEYPLIHVMFFDYTVLHYFIIFCCNKQILEALLYFCSAAEYKTAVMNFEETSHEMQWYFLNALTKLSETKCSYPTLVIYLRNLFLFVIILAEICGSMSNFIVPSFLLSYLLQYINYYMVFTPVLKSKI